MEAAVFNQYQMGGQNRHATKIDGLVSFLTILFLGLLCKAESCT
ncbi:hypothetical protein HMPREF9104_00416 [Lentilactobacillus kisonensis F0435]|uniref:Uncharacterized protein n=1 Tax=Lentilactobacillus kisonensis F0435 TaxID=797516 RepID=H1LCV2_9LACO|nr:hypothetical protein HMPREF9104_00416 [Lentilactobacillus kisonensis F0435]